MTPVGDRVNQILPGNTLLAVAEDNIQELAESGNGWKVGDDVGIAGCDMSKTIVDALCARRGIPIVSCEHSGVSNANKSLSMNSPFADVTI
jgi:hypothetical protein